MTNNGELSEEAVEVEIIDSEEKWSEFTLADKTVLRVRPAILSVYKIPGQTDSEGNPLYQIKAAMLTDVKAAKKITKTKGAK
jgi:hypothetical protein